MTKQQQGLLLGGLVVIWGVLMFTQFSEDSPIVDLSGSPPGGPPPPTGQTSSSSTDLTDMLKPARQTVALQAPPLTTLVVHSCWHRLPGHEAGEQVTLGMSWRWQPCFVGGG